MKEETIHNITLEELINIFGEKVLSEMFVLRSHSNEQEEYIKKFLPNIEVVRQHQMKVIGGKNRSIYVFDRFKYYRP